MSHRTCGSRPPCTRHPIHACAPVRCVVVVFSSPVSSTLFRCSPSGPSRCLPQSSTRGSSPTPCATSAWGPWPLLTTRHPSHKGYCTSYQNSRPKSVARLHFSGEPHERNPDAPKFEDSSQEETEWQEQGAAKQRGSWPKMCSN